jgi:hypothetical protein
MKVAVERTLVAVVEVENVEVPVTDVTVTVGAPKKAVWITVAVCVVSEVVVDVVNTVVGGKILVLITNEGEILAATETTTLTDVVVWL